MSIPSTHRTELLVSSIGLETKPQGILAKNTMWSIQLGYGRLIVKEYEGRVSVLNSFNVKSYKITAALKNDLTLDTDRFWVWVVDYSNILSLYEVEPYVSTPPVITYTKSSIDTNILSLHVIVNPDNPVVVLTLNTSDELRSSLYANIRNPDPPSIEPLEWSGTRLDQFSGYISDDRTGFELAYLDVASPPNVYLDSYAIGIPQNVAVYRVGSTNEAVISWDAVTDANHYTVERDISPLFTSPVSVTTDQITYSDMLPTAGTFYYRVRALNTPLLLQSYWSSTVSISITLSADFIGNPLAIAPEDSVVFTDLSTPVGVITSWDWDFGDGSTSTDQNPTHPYASPGLYTVTLSIANETSEDQVVKTDYIEVIDFVADFIGSPLSGNQPLSVQFTDQSTPIGVVTAWEWDFGDGSTSTDQNPNHIYTFPGLYTVTLRMLTSTSENEVVKTDYIDVKMPLIADFIGSPLSGNQPLQVIFTDLSTPEGAITSWEWDFGDSSPLSALQNPVHSYAIPGRYTVTLRVSNGIYDNQISKVNYIEVVYEAVEEESEPITGGGFTRSGGPTLIFD